jgi:hypothetical protein
MHIYLYNLICPLVYIALSLDWCLLNNYKFCMVMLGGFGGLEVVCWPSHAAETFGFLGRKNSQHAFFGGEVKPSVPYRSFKACKRSLNVTCRSEFRQNYWTFLAYNFTFRRWVLSRGDTRVDAWWQKFERTISLKGLVKNKKK